MVLSDGYPLIFLITHTFTHLLTHLITRLYVKRSIYIVLYIWYLLVGLYCHWFVVDFDESYTKISEIGNHCWHGIADCRSRNGYSATHCS